MKTKSVFYIYGEPTVTISFKVPESKRKEIMDDIRDNVLSKYENPKRVEIKADNTYGVSVKTNRIEKSKSEKKTIEIGDDNKAVAEVSFERVSSLPLGTELFKGYGAKGALRTLDEKEYYTKRTHDGKLEILKHKDLASALLYCEENFK